MITFFTIPKPFEKHISVIQNNAISSWKNLNPNNEIIIYGKEKGISEFSNLNNILNVKDVKYNEFGTPMLDNIFEDVKKRSKNNIIIYCNSDIIFLKDFNKILEIIYPDLLNKDYLICGRRTDLDIDTLIDFKNENWKNDLKEKVLKNGTLHGYSGIDYFIFNKDQKFKLLPFAVGRICWDNWFIYDAIKRDVITVDATEQVIAVHQNHEKAYSILDEESTQNVNLLEGYDKVANIYNANYILIKSSLQRVGLIRRLISFIKITYPFNQLFAFRRKFNLSK
mgnify:CR=1 FL=1